VVHRVGGRLTGCAVGYTKSLSPYLSQVAPSWAAQPGRAPGLTRAPPRANRGLGLRPLQGPLGGPALMRMGGPVLVGMGGTVLVGLVGPVLMRRGVPVLVGLGGPVLMLMGGPVLVGVGGAVLMRRVGH